MVSLDPHVNYYAQHLTALEVARAHALSVAASLAPDALRRRS